MADPEFRAEPPVAEGPEYELVVPGGYGRAFEMKVGQYLTVTDLEGGQVGDLVAFNAHDIHEYLHTACTRIHWCRIYPKVGDIFVTLLHKPVLEIVRDDVGQHDLARAICNPGLYRTVLGVVGEHRSCLENFAEVLAPYGVERWWMPMPFNIFQNTPVMPDGRFELRSPVSKPGDSLVLRAHMDLICGLSACPMEPINGSRITDLKVTVTNSLPG